MEHTDEYTLTSDEMGLVSPIIETVENLQRDAQAILRAITRMRGLEGQWNLVGNRLVKVHQQNGNGPALAAPSNLSSING